jgi:hypothetical protein
MAQKIDPGSERLRACQMAAEALRDKYGSGNKAALATGLRQQSLSDLLSQGKLGLKFADELAEHYETTLDGLVWLFLKGGAGTVRAGNIPGWSRSVEEARAEWGDSSYELAAEVSLPTGPRHASARFVYDLAQIFHVHVKTSSVRAAIRKVN